MVATVVLRQGSGSATCPRLYAVHGLDGDVMGGGSSYVTLAGHLTSWRVVALGYDEEAYACGSVQALAACYNRRVLEDVSKNGKPSAENPIIVAGYSFGCVLAHQMACQLSQDGLDVLLILFDLEVTWPPPKTNARVGGYDFLGGEVEAILLLSRAFGKFEFAHQAVVLLTAAKANDESIDVDFLRREAFAAINHRGLSYELFSALVKKSGVNIEKIHTISDPWHPPEKFIGPALLVLAPDSAEFASAKEINEQYCTQMEVVNGRGSHYNLLQGDHAILAADLLHNFCQRFSPAVSRMPNGGRAERPSKAATRQAIGEDKLLILRRGSPGTPKVYLVHGLDGDVMSGGATFKTIAVHLDPCRVGALIYDSEALACDSVPALCSLYNSRVLSDSEGIRNGAGEDGLIVVAGYSYGCVLAHQMGYQLQQAGVNAAVVMFDLEVTWPPPQTNERVGGYEFLGGEAEAILLICRGFGKFEFAMKEAMELVELQRRNEGFDVDALRERAFKALNQRGMCSRPFELFTMLVKRGGVNIQQLHTIADPWKPPQKYDGPALLVLAPDSQEFAGAKEINAQFCSAMEVATGAGSHYNMMQGAQAAVQAHLVKDFLQRVAGVDVASLSALSPPSAPQPTAKTKGEIAKKAKVGDDKLLILRRGTPGIPKVYLVHGLDGDVMSGGATFKTIAGHLEPCRVGALIYDSKALACDSLCSPLQLVQLARSDLLHSVVFEVPESTFTFTCKGKRWQKSPIWATRCL